MGNHYRCADVHSGNSCGEHLEENMTEIDKNMNVSLISHSKTTFSYDFLHLVSPVSQKKKVTQFCNQVTLNNNYIVDK